MSATSEAFVNSTVDEIKKFEISDLFYHGKNYFSCGFSHDKYYNYSYATAIAIIGKIYGPKGNSRSDYHNGITYIVSELKQLNLSKRQIKALRKNFKVYNGYEFKTPYYIAEIVEKIILLLQQKESEELVADYCKAQRSPFYREMLIERQYLEIQKAASEGHRDKVLAVEGKLGHLTQCFNGRRS